MDYTIAGVLYHSDGHGNMLMHSAKGTEWKNKKYVNKVRTASGKWRYIYSSASSKLKSGVKRIGSKIATPSSSFKTVGELSDEKKKKGGLTRGHITISSSNGRKREIDDNGKTITRSKVSKDTSSRVDGILEKLKEKWNNAVKDSGVGREESSFKTMKELNEEKNNKKKLTTSRVTISSSGGRKTEIEDGETTTTVTKKKKKK